MPNGDAYDPLNTFVSALAGHHWTTLGVADIAVFLILGFIVGQRGFSFDGTRLAALVAGAVMIGAVWRWTGEEE